MIRELKLVPNIYRVLRQPEELLNAEFNILQREVAPLSSEMIENLWPEHILINHIEIGLLMRNSQLRRLSQIGVHVTLHDEVGADLLGTILHHRSQIILLKLYDSLWLIHEKEISFLQLSWIIVTRSGLLHPLVIVELPIDPNGCVVIE